jgi:ring-1,2-phenylacetyl-CoA epoxidase subunit PaaE
MSRVESFRLSLDSKEHTVPIGEGETLLEAALAAGIDAPHNCQEGRCGTCKSWLRSGEVTMETSRPLSPRNRERGLVLACQAIPSSSAEIWLDFDY